MRSFLCIVMFFLISGNLFSQIKVKTTNSGLNLRSEPTTSSTVLYSLPNESELLYANDWAEGWIKVRYSNRYEIDKSGYEETVDVTGWVNINFLETSLFKSTILDPLVLDNESGCLYGIWGINGTLAEFTNEKYNIKINGVGYLLESLNDYSNPNLNYYKWVGNQVKIEFFGADTDRGIESSESKGMLRIEFNGKVEYIYAALGGGC
jgi:hypothetical protein